jgi:hypothetical protein
MNSRHPAARFKDVEGAIVQLTLLVVAISSGLFIWSAAPPSACQLCRLGP